MYIDIAKGIAILAMIIGHSYGKLSWLWESFHMPLFFILSGYFFTKRNNIDVIKKGANSLLKPYFFTIFSLALISILLGSLDSSMRYPRSILFPDGVRENPFMPNWTNSGALWFLPALFWCRLIYNAIEGFCKSRVLLSCCACLLVTCLAAFLGHWLRINIPFGILIGCSGLFFYCIGYLIRKYNMFEKKYPRWILLVFVPFWLVSAKYTTFAMFSFKYDAFYLINVAIAICATTLIVLISKRIESKPLLGGVKYCH